MKNSPVGRPVDYNPLVQIPLMKDLMEKGYWDYEIIAVFEVSKTTFYRWIRENPEFQEAHEIGKNKRAAFWTQLGRNAVLNKEKDFQFKPWISFMNNQMQDFGWGTGEEGKRQTININQMNVLQTKDSTELLEMLQDKLKTLDPKLKQILPIEVKILDEPDPQ